MVTQEIADVIVDGVIKSIGANAQGERFVRFPGVAGDVMVRVKPEVAGTQYLRDGARVRLLCEAREFKGSYSLSAYAVEVNLAAPGGVDGATGEIVDEAVLGLLPDPVDEGA